MARKEAPGASEAHGWSEIIGIVLLGLALLLGAALFSYDRNDVASNRVPPNAQTHNWIGPIGAHLGYGLFSVSALSTHPVKIRSFSTLARSLSI